MANQEMKICAEEALNGNLEDCARLLFPQEGESTPRLRFNGFEDKWVEATLGELFTERVESNINGEMLSVTMNNGVIKAAENGRFDNSNSDKSHYKVVKVNDIAYNSMRMWQGASGCSAYEGIVSPAYTVVTPVEGIDSNFFAYLFKTPSVIRKFRLHSQGLTSDTWNLKYPAFSKILVSYPKDIEEQRLIASFLSSLDKQISAQQKQLERLKQMKQSCLGLLFPDNQSITPPLRFKGFSGGWKSVILMDIMDRYDNLRVPVKESQRVKGEYPYYGANGIQDYVDGYTHDGEFILIAEDGANNLIEYPVQYVNGKVWVNNHAHVLSAKKNVASNMFIKYAISHADVKSVLVGGTRAKLTSDALMKLSVSIPPTINEQCRIASFFSSLDEQIKIQMQQVEKLNQVKKACLNQFIA